MTQRACSARCMPDRAVPDRRGDQRRQFGRADVQHEGRRDRRRELHHLARSGGSEGLGFVITSNMARQLLLDGDSFVERVSRDASPAAASGGAMLLNVPQEIGRARRDRRRSLSMPPSRSGCVAVRYVRFRWRRGAGDPRRRHHPLVSWVSTVKSENMDGRRSARRFAGAQRSGEELVARGVCAAGRSYRVEAAPGSRAYLKPDGARIRSRTVKLTAFMLDRCSSPLVLGSTACRLRLVQRATRAIARAGGPGATSTLPQTCRAVPRAAPAWPAS